MEVLRLPTRLAKRPFIICLVHMPPHPGPLPQLPLAEREENWCYSPAPYHSARSVPRQAAVPGPDAGHHGFATRLHWPPADDNNYAAARSPQKKRGHPIVPVRKHFAEFSATGPALPRARAGRFRIPASRCVLPHREFCPPCPSAPA